MSKLSISLTTLIAITYIISTCHAEIITVGHDEMSDYQSIQQAINNADPDGGDEIVLRPGFYQEDIYFNSTKTILRSENPQDPQVVKDTVLNGTITFDFSEGPDSVVNGLKIIGDYERFSLPTGHIRTKPATHGNIIVWEDKISAGGTENIYALDTETLEVFAVCTAANRQEKPAVYGDTIVWQDKRSGSYDIYGYSIADSNEFLICDVENDQLSPQIWGNIVVWHDMRNGNYDIYGYDLGTHSEIEISKADGAQMNPSIYDNMVVWQGIGAENNVDIFSYNLDTGELQVICDAIQPQNYPAIWGNIVVWHDYRNGNWDIYGYYLSSRQEFEISTKPGNQQYPAVYDTIVTWTDNRNSNYDIYSYNVMTEEEAPICVKSGKQEFSAISGNTIVWQDSRGGNYDIYDFELISTSGGITEVKALEHAIICYWAGPTIINNLFVGCTESAIDCQDFSRPYISANTFEFCNTAITGAGGWIQDNLITKNTTGLIDCFADTTGNTISFNTGFGLTGCGGQIDNNEIISNGLGGLKDCPGDIINNTISENDGDGLIGCDGFISYNTIENNHLLGVNNCDGEVSDNTITNNEKGGVYYCDGDVKYNTIESNSAKGVYNCIGEVLGNRIAFNEEEGVDMCDGTVGDNRIVSNGSHGISNCSNTVRNNIVEGNENHGLFLCTGTIRNNTITGNKSNGLHNCLNIVKNNIIAFNGGKGLYGPADDRAENSYNCFWANESGNFFNNHARTGDISKNPLFVLDGEWYDNFTPDDDTDDIWIEGDYFLRSEDGRWEPYDETGTWVNDTETSPCVNAGDPNTPIYYEEIPNGGIINMGAYGGTALASLSTENQSQTPYPICYEHPTMDANNDCLVDLKDFVLFVEQWLSCGYDIQERCPY